jgi:uncharacterized protein YjbJ (UPF0337 family)
MQARTPIDPYAAGSATIPGAAARVAAAEGAPALPPRVSWGAILAGAVVAVMIGFMLNILGVAVGATAVDAVSRDTPSASTFGIGAAVWLLAATLIGLAVGGYAAARLSGTSDKTDGALHGVGVWAIGFLLSTVLLGQAVSGAASSAFNAASSAIGGAAQGAGSAASAAAGQVNPQALADRARAALSGPSDPASMTTEQRGAEISRILANRVATGSLPDADRQRLGALVAAETGVSQQEATQRVQAYEAEAQRLAGEAEQRARQAANAAATGASTAAFAAFATLLLGAVAAVLGARAGTRDRVAVGPARRAVASDRLPPRTPQTSQSERSTTMADEDRIGGAAQNLAGKAKDAAGGALGDTKLQAEGKADQASGTVRNAVGGAKDAASDAKQAVGDWTEDMQGELSRLRGEVERLMRDRVSPALSEAADTAGDYAQRAKDVAVRQGEYAAGVVKENPLVTVGLVAAVAFLLGRLTGGDRTHHGLPWR